MSATASTEVVELQYADATTVVQMLEHMQQ
jgi:hypothetical protein